ncbi:hypothetical protein GH741_04345 [Aquibacillus halophilus]|uniref:Peptidyl-prolyl cis-trans isomerase n=1 Tax=Aquibacillus halophilus TaxID=930132 RepID=A0A6A8D818_9BACI|nr:hypothetical protein [Aquibacillus halophilus]
MIVQLTGAVRYSITLDPTVWIFDDRKIIFDEAFNKKSQTKEIEVDELKNASERFNRELNLERIKPPVNKSISKYEREKILKNTYVMPIKDFLTTSEIKKEATQARILTTNGDIILSLDSLTNSLLLFAIEGKPVSVEGPVHLYFGDGSNKDNPIKGINKIAIE